MVAELVESTGVATVEVDGRYSSGLTRPDFFDWSAEVDDVLRRERPEVVVVLMGANDSQPLVEDDTVHEPGTAGFATAYEARVASLMTRLAEHGRYAEALPDDEGVVRVLRGGDGIHLSRDGAARLAAHVFAHVDLPTDSPVTVPTEEPVP